MHPTAIDNATKFVSKYGKYLFELAGQRMPPEIGKAPRQAKVLDVGSYDVNGTLRPIFKNFNYCGTDIVKGPGVDVVSKNGNLCFADNSFDLAVSSSCMEHDAVFWVTFLEMVRVVLPGGLIYLCVPSSGPEHHRPDRWRFLSGAYDALADWSAEVSLIESYIDQRGTWKDAVGVFRVNGDRHANL